MKAILCLHGLTMCGASMRRTMGPLGDALEAAGFELIVPDGPVMPDRAVAKAAAWARHIYTELGQDAESAFSDKLFWGASHHAWTQPDKVDGLRHYLALPESLERLRRAVEGRDVVGVLGFSEGCAMAGIFAGLAQRDPSLPTLRFGVFLAGFYPEFDRPALDLWPVDLPARFAVGDRDAVFPDPAILGRLASQFTGAPEVEVLPGVEHLISGDPEWIARTVEFTRAHLQ